MNRTLLLTGATGALGVPLLAELLRARVFGRIIVLVRGDPTALHTALLCELPGIDLGALITLRGELGTANTASALAALPVVDCVIHAAACTKFRAPAAQLTSVNVEGTRQILAWAASQARPPRVLHFSTTCVAGQRMGEVAESPLPDDCGFVNDYERTKWQAEQLVAASPLQPEIIRLATVIGSVRDGHLQRPGAFHTTLRWLYAGLLPMVPGDETTRLDLLPTELVTGFVLRLLARPPEPGGIYHVSNGAHGVPLGEMLDFATQKFAMRSPAWRGGQILPPVLAPRAAFEDFRLSIARSRDFIFNQVLESVDSFLPELFYPKRYVTARAESVWGGALLLPDWREWVGRVVDYALDTDFGRKETPIPLPMSPPAATPSYANHDEFAAALRDFINHELPRLHKKVQANPNVTADTLLFATGVIDSLAILHLIGFIERATGQTIPQEKVVMKYFQTVTAIADSFWTPSATP